MKSSPILIDCDAGIDDLLAIVLALRSPELKVLGISTVEGNVTVAQATRNVLGLLSLLDREDVPVAAGKKQRARTELISHDAAKIHGPTGTGSARFPCPKVKASTLNAWGLFEEVIDAYPSKTVTLVCTAPMTNVAYFIRRAPDTAVRLKRIITMAGAFGLTPFGVGNITPWAEFNVFVDPGASLEVFQSGIPVWTVGLDATNSYSMRIDQKRLDALSSIGTLGAHLTHDLLGEVIGELGPFSVHDFFAMSVAVSPGSFHFISGNVSVDVSRSPTRGRTTLVRRLPIHSPVSTRRAVHVCDAANARRLHRLFLDRVVKG